MSNKKTIQGSVGTSVPDGWHETTLKGVSNVLFSNVDKKSHEGEIPVRLCNYMDVYRNDYIRDGIPFMEASATKSELRRFSIKKGDVIITKDSETPNDIGIPTAILEDIENLVCGYHLALIQPDADKVESVVLSKLIGSNSVSRYYARQANGLTRYGLSTQSINDTPLVLPKSVDEQKAIGNVLFSIDQAIEQAEAIIAKYKRIKQGLMRDLLTKGIDENGNIRSEKSHKFKNSPLGRIPVEWDTGPVTKCAETLYGFAFESDQFIDEGAGTRLLRGLNVSRGFIRWSKDKTVIWPFMSKRLSRYLLKEHDLVIGMDGALVGYNFSSVTTEDLPCLLVQRVARLRANSKMNPTLLKMYFASPRFVQYVNTVKTHTAIPHISGEDIETFRIPLPSPEEQELIGESFSACEEALEAETRTLTKLMAIKRGLMQDLLSGEVRVTPLMQKV